MYKDLLSEYKLIGMTKNEMIDLLGEQSDRHYFKQWDLRYWLGPEPGPIRIDSIWLVINFEDNRVVEYKILTD